MVPLRPPGWTSTPGPALELREQEKEVSVTETELPGGRVGTSFSGSLELPAPGPATFSSGAYLEAEQSLGKPGL